MLVRVIYGLLVVAVSYGPLAKELDLVLNLATTTDKPDECGLFRQTQSCHDETFRVACPHWCDIHCPGPGFVYIESRKLCFAMTKQETAFWPHAHEHCRAYGARLARIETLEDIDVVNSLLNATNSAHLTHYSVGVANFGVVDEWAWLDGNQLSTDEDFWARGYPWFVPNKPGCGYVYVGNMEKKENNVCNQHMGFICEQEPNVVDLFDENGSFIITGPGNSVIISPDVPKDLI